MELIRVLLRNIQTGRFLAGSGRWVSRRDQARNFVHVSEAIIHSVTLTASPLEVLIDFDDPKYDVGIPLGAFGANWCQKGVG